MDNKNLKRIMILGIIMFFFFVLYLFNPPSLKKIKNEFKKEADLFELAKRAFGKELLYLYDNSSSVSCILKKYELQEGLWIVRQETPYLYLSTAGVIMSAKDNSIIASTQSGNYRYYGLKQLLVGNYSKIEATKALAILDFTGDSYYYYLQKL